MKIKSNNYEVFETGTVISYEGESLTFELSENMKIRFVFFEDTKNIDHRLEFNLISNNELELLFYNFNNSLGLGNYNPLNLGTLNNRGIYLNYRIYALTPNTSKTIQYTFYLREEAANG